ncbi:MAG: PRC-barrel domain containing protein [Candidatus Riflebacteria bacterium]|nr:PRC-barrel domain containing protein [Candidatus Riflebacteria bacterium]
MLRSVNSLIGYSITVSEGKFGEVSEFAFDSTTWTLRYLVVESGRWLSGRIFLISPAALGNLDWPMQTFLVNLTMEQIRTSPEIAMEKPVTRQLETELFNHYHWPAYWTSKEITESTDHSPPQPSADDLHLCDTHTTFGIHAVDGEIGHVEDYIVNTDNWSLNFLVVRTANWLPGKKVLISPQLINHLDYANKTLYVNLTKEAVENSLEFDPTRLVNTLYEAHLYDYYGRPKMEPAARSKLFGF